MLDKTTPTAAEIRAARAQNPKMRERDFAESLNISEAELIAAYCGEHEGMRVTRIAAKPDGIVKAAIAFGEVLALTRNESCVIERVGTYDEWHDGAHASMILGPEVDLRIFGKFWTHAFAVEKTTETGLRRSLQVFSGTGMAVHKIHLRDTSNHDKWDECIAALALDDQGALLEIRTKGAPEMPNADPAKAEELRAEWDKMTDTHQFGRLTSRLKMNRLGAYRIAGAPYVQPVETAAVSLAIEAAVEKKAKIMVFVGNRGCIQIHGGYVENTKRMGPWFNILDERFDLHLREDHLAEVYIVTKPTKRGPALSLEAFDAEGRIILQIFPDRREDPTMAAMWDTILVDLPRKEADQ
ncbi:hemin-degrading factor [Halocynthiibacter namhaensis]|uniref:hemin-degrading factor n=1 Tax=Halocynthiibacter namhaensis TaxID=1290553 RepID=UPI0005796264|nr:hemin-degrading factor [Halocynthiibacter namhaensis]